MGGENCIVSSFLPPLVTSNSTQSGLAYNYRVEEGIELYFWAFNFLILTHFNTTEKVSDNFLMPEVLLSVSLVQHLLRSMLERYIFPRRLGPHRNQNHTKKRKLAALC